jgi:hypothetical protein
MKESRVHTHLKNENVLVYKSQKPRALSAGVSVESSSAGVTLFHFDRARRTDVDARVAVDAILGFDNSTVFRNRDGRRRTGLFAALAGGAELFFNYGGHGNLR